MHSLSVLTFSKFSLFLMIYMSVIFCKAQFASLVYIEILLRYVPLEQAYKELV